ncbi:hypothetical protein ANANG_G00308470 [Anguilla anguilla]|uniref:Uncharacterized protein n=1 Tax=Anguilla anguilla TaxID=7936 RepID=A0A9D3LHZ0_ANGAN|nr:hypothetical protein ANANG_G00308470 [Anguilla anguilla]
MECDLQRPLNATGLQHLLNYVQGLRILLLSLSAFWVISNLTILEQFLHLHERIQYRRIFRKTIKAFWATQTQVALKQFQLFSLLQLHQSAQERLK